jgi:acyl carrier protein
MISGSAGGHAARRLDCNRGYVARDAGVNRLRGCAAVVRGGAVIIPGIAKNERQVMNEVESTTAQRQAMNQVESTTAQEQELAKLIVASLNLEIQPDEIDPAAPLYREGLGLDSIDILEIALAVSKTYGFQLRSDDEDNLKTFSSLRNLNEHVQQHRTR